MFCSIALAVCVFLCIIIENSLAVTIYYYELKATNKKPWIGFGGNYSCIEDTFCSILHLRSFDGLQIRCSKENRCTIFDLEIWVFISECKKESLKSNWRNQWRWIGIKKTFSSFAFLIYFFCSKFSFFPAEIKQKLMKFFLFCCWMR